MERKDANLIIILIIIAVFLAISLMIKNAPTVMISEPKEEMTSSYNFFIPVDSSPKELSLEELLRGILVLNTKEGVELSQVQRQKIQAILKNIKPGQDKFKNIAQGIETESSKLVTVLNKKQIEYLNQNTGTIRMSRPEGGVVEDYLPMKLLEQVEQNLK